MILRLLILSLIFMPMQKVAGPSKVVGPVKLGGPTVIITRVQHNEIAAQNCSPTCSLTVTSTGSGNLMVIHYATNTATNITISSVTGAGSWTASGACHASSTVSTLGSDIAYNLSNTSGVTSLSVTLSTNDTAADFEVFEYSRNVGTWTLDGTCQTITNPSAAFLSTTGSFTTSAGNIDVISAVLVPDHIFCSGETVNPVGVGWTNTNFATASNTKSGFVDALGVVPGTYQATLQQQGNATCPTAQASGDWASSGLAFK